EGVISGREHAPVGKGRGFGLGAVRGATQGTGWESFGGGAVSPFAVLALVGAGDRDRVTHRRDLLARLLGSSICRDAPIMGSKTRKHHTLSMNVDVWAVQIPTHGLGKAPGARTSMCQSVRYAMRC